MADVTKKKQPRAHRLAAQIESWGDNTPIQQVASILGDKENRRMLVDAMRLFCEREEVNRLVVLLATEADNWYDGIPDAYRPLCTEPGHTSAHPGSETSYCLGDLRSARNITRGLCVDEGCPQHGTPHVCESTKSGKKQ